MQDWTIGDYLDRLAARHPTPAGSAVAALNLAQAAALLAMVARFRDAPDALARTEELRAQAIALADDDARAVEQVAAAYRLPRSTDAERERRAAAIADRLLAAAEPPARAVPLGAELIGLCERLSEVATGALRADVAAAADATAAALSISRTNVEADVAGHRGTAEVDRLAAAVVPVDALLERIVRLKGSGPVVSG